jgi:LacI family transcriptional regulator
MIKMSITIKDIAKIAGVSYSTVSRSLNDSPVVSEQTKAKVKKIAGELGFEFNANARSLSTKKTGTIGVVYPRNFDEFSMDLYFSSLHNQIRKSLEKEELDVIIAFPENKFTRENNIKKLINRQKVDGLIILKAFVENELLQFLKNSNIPYVFLHYEPSSGMENGIDVIYTDQFKGGYMATEHLIKLGHKKIATITAEAEGNEFPLRTQAYKAALEDYGIAYDEELVFKAITTFQSGYDMIKENWDTIKKATAIFVQTDLIAMGVLEALRDLEVNVPKDIALVGYDDVKMGTYFKPRLTTVHQPREEIAVLGCERLIELLHSSKPKVGQKLILPPRLVIRDTCGMKNKE